jgi:tRNA (adenine22-N1)-methyltransferase
MRLPPRLKGLLAVVPYGLPVADIGSGHGRLAVALAQRGQRVVATERTSLLLDRLRAEVAAGGRLAGAAAMLSLRQGDGLEALAPGEVSVAVVAGMGPLSITRILSNAPWLPEWLVLQPMQKPELLEEWIERIGWPATCWVITQGSRRYRTWRVECPAAVRKPAA